MTDRRRSDDGSMLVELVVGMILMSIVGLIVLDGIVGGFKAQRGLQDRGEALAQVRMAAQRVTREVREADPIVIAEATQIAVKHDTDTGSVIKRWYLDTATSSLMLDTTVTTVVGGVSTTAPTVTTTVLSKLDTTQLPFDYRSSTSWNAASVPAGYTVDNGTCATAGTSPVSYWKDCIGRVELSLIRNIPGHTAVTVNAEVELRNSE